MNPNSLRKFYGHFHLVHHLQTRIEATNEEFFDELSTHLESLASYSYPVYIMSDFNRSPRLADSLFRPPRREGQ